MRNYSIYLFCLAFILLHPSCRKESQIRESLETGVTAGRTAYRLLSVTHILEQIALGRTDDFFTNQTTILETDSVYSDGDGIAYIVNFGSGVLCSDGVLRKGKCVLELVDSLLPLKGNCQWKASAGDSFFVFAKTGWIQIQGNLDWKKTDVDTANIGFSLSFVDADSLHVTSSFVGVKYAQPLGTYKNGEVWNGTWVISDAQNKREVVAKQLQNIGACRSNWNGGGLEVKDTKKPWTVEMNPFGNDACDQVFKVSRKVKKIGIDEMTFDAW